MPRGTAEHADFARSRQAADARGRMRTRSWRGSSRASDFRRGRHQGKGGNSADSLAGEPTVATHRAWRQPCGPQAGCGQPPAKHVSRSAASQRDRAEAETRRTQPASHSARSCRRCPCRGPRSLPLSHAARFHSPPPALPASGPSSPQLVRPPGADPTLAGCVMLWKIAQFITGR